jgi:hypothetical protein
MATNRWIDPPDRPHEEEVERLCAACREESRIAEVWVTGSRFTLDDGSSSDSTGIAVVLDPPIADHPEENEVAATARLTANLKTASPIGGNRSSLFVTRNIIATHQEHCLPIYIRASTT